MVWKSILKVTFKNSIIHEENTKKNHKRVVSLYVIKGIRNGFPCRIAWSMHDGCRETFGKRENTRAASECVLNSGEASPTVWSCYANISVFIDRKNNQFLKKWIMIMIYNLHSMTKLSGWLRHWTSYAFRKSSDIPSAWITRSCLENHLVIVL
jgi:hypothetical protein